MGFAKRKESCESTGTECAPASSPRQWSILRQPLRFKPGIFPVVAGADGLHHVSCERQARSKKNRTVLGKNYLRRSRPFSLTTGPKSAQFLLGTAWSAFGCAHANSGEQGHCSRGYGVGLRGPVRSDTPFQSSFRSDHQPTTAEPGGLCRTNSDLYGCRGLVRAGADLQLDFQRRQRWVQQQFVHALELPACG